MIKIEFWYNIKLINIYIYMTILENTMKEFIEADKQTIESLTKENYELKEKLSSVLDIRFCIKI